MTERNPFMQTKEPVTFQEKNGVPPPERRRYLLGSEKESPLPDRQLGLQALQEKNRNCEHVVVVGATGGAASLAIKMRGQDVCPHCTRREAAYWRDRAKTAEGMLAQAEPARDASEPAPRSEGG